MKTTLLIGCLLTLSAATYCQTIELDPATSKYSVSAVVQVDSLTKDQLYAGAKEWIARQYRNANDVIQMADKESGKIIGKGNFSTSLFMNMSRWQVN